MQSVLVTVQAVQMEKSSCAGKGCIDVAPYNDTWLTPTMTPKTVQPVQLFHVKLLYSNNTTIHPGLLSVHPDRCKSLLKYVRNLYKMVFIATNKGLIK